MPLPCFCRVLVVAALGALAVPLGAQIQPQAPLEGEMLPVQSVTRDNLDVIKDGRTRIVGPQDYKIKQGPGFGEGTVKIEHEETDFNALRGASAADRNRSDVIRFRYRAEITADRSLSSCYGLLTFVSQGSVGSWMVPIGHLGSGSSHRVEVEMPIQAQKVGSLHIFSQGLEIRTNQHPDAYDMRVYYASLLKGVRGIPAAALLDAATFYPHVLSDDGHYLATFRNRNANRLLLVVDLTTMKIVRETPMTNVDFFSDGPVWVSDHEIAYLAQPPERIRGATIHLFVFDINTGQKRQMLEDVRSIVRRVRGHPEILVLISYHNGDSFFKCDTRTGRAFGFEDPDGGNYFFDFDGTSRVESKVRENRLTYYCRPTPGSAWQHLDGIIKQPGLHFDSHGHEYLDRVADIIGMGPDGDTLYIANRAGKDRFELAAFSLAEGVIKHTLARLPETDLTNTDSNVLGLELPREGGRLLGILYEDQKPHIIWTDPRFRANQKAVDAAFPDHFNAPVDFTDDGQTMVFLSSSPHDPGTYYVFRAAASQLIPLMSRDEHLAGLKLAVTSPIKFPARDGHPIPAYLTRPAGAAGATPLLAYVHGGPAARDHLGFDPWVQFFASRGYAVLQVNYRGSSGFGSAFQHAGLDARLDSVVIDDIADGVKHLIESGVADPKRIAVIGASFGGWATYISLAKYPELYRAGIAVSAVSSWRRVMNDDRSAFDNQFAYRYMKAILDRQNFSANAGFIEPVLRTREIHQPIFIAHGERDTTVDASEAGQMVSALRKTNQNVEAKSFDQATHTYWPFADQVELLNESADFLERFGMAPGAN